jgi:hypothetical protein
MHFMTTTTLMPNFGHFPNPCSFLFVFDPMRQKNRGEKKQIRVGL